MKYDKLHSTVCFFVCFSNTTPQLLICLLALQCSLFSTMKFSQTIYSACSRCSSEIQTSARFYFTIFCQNLCFPININPPSKNSKPILSTLPQRVISTIPSPSSLSSSRCCQTLIQTLFHHMHFIHIYELYTFNFESCLWVCI